MFKILLKLVTVFFKFKAQNFKLTVFSNSNGIFKFDYQSCNDSNLDQDHLKYKINF